MNKQTLSFLKEKVHNLTTSPGVYKMLDEYGNIIYIGKAKNLKNRVSSYFIDTLKPEKVTQMVNHIADFEYIVTNTELEALNLESNLIHNHLPFYNILLKDGKAFPYIRIDTSVDFPRIEVVRKVKKDKALYFGPYFNNIPIQNLIKIINNAFKLRTCSHNLKVDKCLKRECLEYQLGNCSAPCTNKISKAEYKEEVNKVIKFLKGNTDDVKKELTIKMKLCAEQLLFEKALEYKESLQILDNMYKFVITELATSDNIDVFGFSTNGINSVISVLCVRTGKTIGVNNYNIYDAGNNADDIIINFISQYYKSQNVEPDIVLCDIEDVKTLEEHLNSFSKNKVKVENPKKSIKKKLLNLSVKNAKEYMEKSIEKDKLQELKTSGAISLLKEKLGLKKLPYRIEGFDISNLSGTNTVASMVVFENGVPNKKHYRKFKVNINQQNDFESMHQVLTRRINELTSDDISFSKTPDLILIDGGKGQLGMAYDVLQKAGLDIDMISLAKREEEIFLPNKSLPVVLSKDNFALKLLQNVRDESHRFAITFQRNLRTNKTFESELSKIDKIGSNKITLLFKHFKSIDNIKNAGISELMKVEGVGKTLAENIFNHFHK